MGSINQQVPPSTSTCLYFIWKLGLLLGLKCPPALSLLRPRPSGCPQSLAPGAPRRSEPPGDASWSHHFPPLLILQGSPGYWSQTQSPRAPPCPTAPRALLEQGPELVLSSREPGDVAKGSGCCLRGTGPSCPQVFPARSGRGAFAGAQLSCRPPPHPPLTALAGRVPSMPCGDTREAGGLALHLPLP